MPQEDTIGASVHSGWSQVIVQHLQSMLDNEQSVQRQQLPPHTDSSDCRELCP